MSEQVDTPDVAARRDVCLRRLKFGKIESENGELTRTAAYKSDRRQTFKVIARVAKGRRAALVDFTENLHGSFEARPDDGTFRAGLEKAEPTKGGRRDDETRGITIEM